MMNRREQMKSELQRIPVEYTTDMGTVKDTPPIECDPFSSQAPFQLDPASFTDDFPSDEELFNVIGTADALVAGTEIGEEVVDFSKPSTRDCWLCGKVHGGECVLDDEYWQRAEKAHREHEAKNICELCGQFSRKSAIHNECHDRERAASEGYN